MDIKKFGEEESFVRIVCANVLSGYYVHDFKCTTNQYYEILQYALKVIGNKNLCGSSGHFESEKLTPEQAVNKYNGGKT
ncbi:MAG: hypothetical protein WC373_00835 [Smithella sp.]|jgi:hypothetical protein